MASLFDDALQLARQYVDRQFDSLTEANYQAQAQITQLLDEKTLNQRILDQLQASLERLTEEFEEYKRTHPDVPPPPTPQPVVIGAYNGNPAEDPTQKFRNYTGGKVPGIQSYYWQKPDSINIAYLSAASEAGIQNLSTLTTRATPGLIGRIADFDAVGREFVDKYLLSLSKIKGRQLATLNHEWEVGVNQKIFTDLRDVDPLTYARAFDVCYRRASEMAPNVDWVFWCGGSDKKLIAEVLKNIRTEPKVVFYDPYTWPWSPKDQTPYDCWAPTANWFRSNPDYDRIGAPPLGLAEFGVTTDFGDVACETYFKRIRSDAENVGLKYLCHFNRNKAENNTVNNWKIDTGLFPRAVRAFTGALS